jgi:hypothetical protein
MSKKRGAHFLYNGNKYQVCGNCLYWNQGGKDLDQCHKHAPTNITWPWTYKNQFCGDWLDMTGLWDEYLTASHMTDDFSFDEFLYKKYGE